MKIQSDIFDVESYEAGKLESKEMKSFINSISEAKLQFTNPEELIQNMCKKVDPKVREAIHQEYSKVREQIC